MKQNTLIITFNVGSATLKAGVYQVLHGVTLEPDAAALHQKKTANMANQAVIKPLIFSVNINLQQQRAVWQGDVPEDLTNWTPPDNLPQVATALLASVKQHYPNTTLCCAHRVVHGGEQFQPVLINEAMLAKLHALSPLCPLHQPPALSVIETIKNYDLNVLQVAAFDTAFHANHPRLWYEYALPQYLRVQGVRGYGFHGLSYQFIMRQLWQHHPKLAEGKLIVAHLGSGCSITAIQNGYSIDSTLGFSGLDGVPMGTRPGHLDSGVLLYMMSQGMSEEDITTCLYKQSGLLGLSGISNDVQTLSQSGDENAVFALDHFCAHVAKAIMGLTTPLQGLDAIVFTGGIGEHQADIRQQIIDHLAWFGIQLAAEKNQTVDLATAITNIATEHSNVGVFVMPTDEQFELYMAAQQCIH